MDWRKEQYKRLPHFEHLNASIVHDEFHAIIGPAIGKLGFQRLKEDTWLRPVTNEIDHVICLHALKGLSHQILIGVRLAFAPRVSQSSVRNHTSSERGWETLDLVHDPFAEKEYNPIEQHIDAGSGYKYLRKDLRRQKKFLLPYLISYFNNADTLDTVLERYEAERSRKHTGLGFENRNRHLVAYPFLLARLGQLDTARTLIEKYLDSLEATQSVRKIVFDRLLEVADLAR